jgi:5'(3')-deoxyribonucleotidase
MTATRPPAVAIDLDDVCADRLGLIAEMLRLEGLDIADRQPTDWDLRDWGVRGKAHYDRLHYAAFVHRAGYRSMAALPGAVDGIRDLHTDYRIRVVTGRLWNSQVVLPALSDTGHWLAEHGVPVDDVAFVSDKTTIKADAYIEDAPHFIAELQAAGRKVIVFDARYNRHLPGPRARSWDEAVHLVRRLVRPASLRMDDTSDRHRGEATLCL